MDINEYLSRKVSVEDDFCFVIMPFEDDLSPVFHNGIKPIVEELGYRCRRADEHFGSSPIMFEIFDDILKAQFVIADLTGSNPNVFYELGISHALKRNVILLKRAGSNVPFDLHGIRHFEYEDSFKGISDLRAFITAALTKGDHQDSSEVFDKRALESALKKACHIWRVDGTVLINFEAFLEIALGLDLLSPSDEEIAFLSHAASYFGKFMRRMTDVAKENRLAIRALVKEVAVGSTTRVPWRAAAMLENLNPALVEEEIRAYADEVANPWVFPSVILKHETASRLAETIKDPSMSAAKRDKLAEALRQIRAEYRMAAQKR